MSIRIHNVRMSQVRHVQVKIGGTSRFPSICTVTTRAVAWGLPSGFYTWTTLAEASFFADIQHYSATLIDHQLMTNPLARGGSRGFANTLPLFQPWASARCQVIDLANHRHKMITSAA